MSPLTTGPRAPGGAGPDRPRRWSQRRRWLLVAAAATMMVAGCGSGSGETVDAAGPADTLAPSTFEGTATTIDGDSIDLASLAGNDLVVWFWAPW